MGLQDNEIEIEIKDDMIEASVEMNESIVIDNYNSLKNKPSINNVELSGNKTLDELGIQEKGEYLLPDDIKDYATKEYVEQEIANFDFIKIVTELPETGFINRTYFVPKIDTESNDLYDEYMWIDNKWELIGTKQIEVDLTNYVKNTDYATSSKGGTVKTQDSYGIAINSIGQLYINGATNDEIVAKGSTLKPILPKNIDSLVKVGITTNQNKLTEEEKQSAQNWIGITDIKEEINEKDVNQDKLIEQLQVENEELQLECKRLREDNQAIAIVGQESGENITLNDSSDARFKKFEIGGNSSQETREGYNLIGLKDGTYSLNVITAVVSNGEVILNGVATESTFLFIPLVNQVELIQNTLYQMYAFNDTATDDVIFRPNGNDGVRQVPFSSVNNVSAYQNSQASVTLSSIMIKISSGATLSNIKCKPMITKGNDTTKEYEQYGASPSPEFPSEIKTVGQSGSAEISVDNGLETTDTNYQSYTKTLPIQQEMLEGDKFIKQDGKWYESHYHPKIVFDGTETWFWSKSSTGFNRFSTIINNAKPLSALISNIATNNLSNQRYGIAFINENKYLYIYKDSTDVDEWKTYLAEQYASGTPAIVYYESTEPELIPCTPEQEKILNEIEQELHTYKGTTHISISSGEINAIANVEYLKDLEVYIADKLHEHIGAI